MMRVVYFAAVREAIATDSEEVEFPQTIVTVADAVEWLCGKSPAHASAFARRDRLRFALDQIMVKADAPIDGAREFAIFPPVTGG